MNTKKLAAAVQPHLAPVALAALTALLLHQSVKKAAVSAARDEAVKVLTGSAR